MGTRPQDETELKPILLSQALFIQARNQGIYVNSHAG